MIKTKFSIYVLLLSLFSTPVSAEAPKIKIDEDSKHIESNLHIVRQANNKLKYRSSYYSTAREEKNCQIYKSISEPDCSVPYITIDMELILAKKLYTDITAYEGYEVKNQVDNNTYVYGRNIEIKPKSIYFSSDLISTRGCYDSGTFVDGVMNNIDEFLAKANQTSVRFERDRRFNNCIQSSMKDEDYGKYSETISIKLSLNDLRKLLVSNHVEVKVFDDVYVFPWQVIQDLKLFYDAVYRTHESDFLVNKPEHSSPFNN